MKKSTKYKKEGRILFQKPVNKCDVPTVIYAKISIILSGYDVSPEIE
jgi:hypothetical protein